VQPVDKQAFRATHVVVFEGVGQAYVQRIAEVFADVEVAEIGDSWALRVVRRGTGATVAKIFSGIGAAVADLSDQEVDALGRDPRIQLCRRERRRLPRYWAGRPPVAKRLTVASIAPSADHSWCLDAVGVTTGNGLTGDGVIVAVLDSGIVVDHPDFRGRIVPGCNARSFVPDAAVEDDIGHGTACAGIIAGAERSAGGLRYSVAPGATLLTGRVVDSEDTAQDDWVLEGIAWAASRGARVISLSLEVERLEGQPYLKCYEAIAARLLRRDPGTLIVAAGGNSGNGYPVANPAACPSILAVGAVDECKALAPFSTTTLDAQRVDLVAPGIRVYSAARGDEGWDWFEGTSMAAPHVAGVAALYLQRDQTSALELWSALEKRAEDLGDKQKFGYGLVKGPPVSV
jgi:subtilisin family serine protease